MLAHENNDAFWRLIIFYATLGILCGILAKRAKSNTSSDRAARSGRDAILLTITMIYGSIELRDLAPTILLAVAVAAIVSAYAFIMEFSRRPSK